MMYNNNMHELISLLFDDLIVGTGKRVTRLMLPASFRDSRVTHVAIGYTTWVTLLIAAVFIIRIVLD